MDDRSIADDDLARRYRQARGQLSVPGDHPDEHLWVALATNAADASTRTAAFDHILRCPDCARVWRALQALRLLAEGEGLATAPADARAGWLSSPAARYTVAATLVMGIAASFWLGGRFAGPPAPDVVRSGTGTAAALAVAAVLDMQPGVEAIARRAVTLVTCPTPALEGGERLQASLAGPSSQIVWTAQDVDPVSGHVRVVVDLTDLEAGTWTLRLLRMDASGGERGATACGFELR